MYQPEKYQELISTSTIVTVPVCVFLFLVSIFLMNLLVAQLSQSYHDAYANMQAGTRSGLAVRVSAGLCSPEPSKRDSHHGAECLAQEVVEVFEGHGFRNLEAFIYPEYIQNI